ncbi:NAD-dependent epimerase/dehydratase family protein [Brachybacterium sp. JHP9]|uniref:NAD-dependent epimerase/dehydratase family protein n=1 Tax=Brachybacterium equifaecis TaxID=2910770 RepID=A0ABT0R2R6_9MICO|nr:NAD-dependent epimerase/dehydratase family protein [Brachybacterium equifaecis]MCL6424196.1 NAD-dependent epimerase/dehydratase family protein [Brachybacterium equifaecis]
MRSLIIGAGQIGQSLVAELHSRGHETVVLRRSADPVLGTSTVAGDAADRQLLTELARGASAIFHTAHAAYDPRSWRRELPHRERAVMDAAAEAGIPVVFPESVYAFGRGAENLHEGDPVQPCSPLGEVRAELLDARRAHGARTLSIVASDLLGPTATAKGSIPRATVVDPVSSGRSAWVLGDPDTPHAMTWIPDLAHAMAESAARAEQLTTSGDAVLLAPTPPAISLRALAQFVDESESPRVRRIPDWALVPLFPFSPTTRSLHRQLYLWERPVRLHPGALTTVHGLAPTPWDAMGWGGRERS